MKSKIFTIGLLLIIISCKTYTIPTESFKNQFTKTENIQEKEVEINNPLLYGNLKYSANNIKTLNVIDKNGNKYFFEVGVGELDGWE